jgi:hypothetical protein
MRRFPTRQNEEDGVGVRKEKKNNDAANQSVVVTGFAVDGTIKTHVFGGGVGRGGLT